MILTCWLIVVILAVVNDSMLLIVVVRDNLTFLWSIMTAVSKNIVTVIIMLKLTKKKN